MISLRLPAAFAISSCLLATVLPIPRVVYADSAEPAKLVRFSDLNLNNREGAKLLYRRIRSAAREVCGPALRTGTRIPSAEWQACVANAVTAAVQGVDRPMLTAYHDEYTGRAIPPRWTRTAGN
jgi:UrcA family protein